MLLISEWWNALNFTEQIFWGIAIIFSVLFIIQFGLSLFGLDMDTEVDAELDADADYSLDPSFTLLSVRSIIAFFTFFGWAGVLAISNGYGMTMILLFAFFSGLAAMGLVAYMMYFFSQLAEAGNADVKDLLYKNGTVYLTVPENRKGRGKIHVILNNSLREMDAVTEGDRLENGKEVKIVDIVERNLLVVEPVEIYQ